MFYCQDHEREVLNDRYHPHFAPLLRPRRCAIILILKQFCGKLKFGDTYNRCKRDMAYQKSECEKPGVNRIGLTSFVDSVVCCCCGMSAVGLIPMSV